MIDWVRNILGWEKKGSSPNPNHEEPIIIIDPAILKQQIQDLEARIQEIQKKRDEEKKGLTNKIENLKKNLGDEKEQNQALEAKNKELMKTYEEEKNLIGKKIDNLLRKHSDERMELEKKLALLKEEKEKALKDLQDNAEKAEAFSKIQAEKIGVLDQKIQELEIQCDPSIISLKSNSNDKSISEKRMKMVQTIENFFANDFADFLGVLVESLEISGKELKTKFHAQLVKLCFVGVEKKVNEILLKNGKYSKTDELMKLFEKEGSEIKKEYFSNFFKAIGTEFGNDIKSVENFEFETIKSKIENEEWEILDEKISELFKICIEMKGLKLSFIVSNENDDFCEQLHDARNSDVKLKTKYPKIVQTMIPGVIIDDVETWKNYVKKRADVIIQ